MTENRSEHDLRAEEADPWLGVNVLTEFVFCSRAGIIEVEKQRDDLGEDEEEPRASVNYMPPHEIADIVREIERTTRWMFRWLPVPFISLAITLATGWWFGWCPAVVGVFFTVGLSKPVFTAMEQLRKLKELYAFAESRTPAEPDPLVRSHQEVNWWELRKAGFEPFKPQRKLEDVDQRLLGRPWRILRRGDVQIPVFKKRIDGANPETIFPQHCVRMAAYCHLLERCTGAKSPYGIVLFGFTYRGKAINAFAARPAFVEGLLSARRVVRAMRTGTAPAPAPPSSCSGCPHGKPFAKAPMHVHQSAEKPRRTIGADGREYRSECGDRFAWIPPHQKARQKELRRE